MTHFETRVQEAGEAPVRRSYALYVFFLCFFLMLLDYMARQVVVSMFPVLKAQWSLSDTRLGWLVSAVSLAVGVLSVPLALVADRYSRVKAIAVMAVVWSAATAAGALAHTYEQLLLARFLVGVGEAAYGAAADTLRRVEQLWMQSYHHRVNLLNPSFSSAGIGVTRAKGWLWVTLQLYG
jgi:MFS family permease